MEAHTHGVFFLSHKSVSYRNELQDRIRRECALQVPAFVLLYILLCLIHLQREAARDRLHADLVTVRFVSLFILCLKSYVMSQVGRPVMQRSSGSFVEVLIGSFFFVS